MQFNSTAGMESVHFSGRRFYSISKILGTFSYHYDGCFLKGVMKQSFCGILWSWISFGVFLSVILLNVLTFNSTGQDYDNILATVWQASFVICLTTLFIGKIFQLCQHTSIAEFLTVIDDFDDKVQQTKV